MSEHGGVGNYKSGWEMESASVCVYVCVEVLLFYRGWSKMTFEQKSESKEQAV